MGDTKAKSSFFIEAKECFGLAIGQVFKDVTAAVDYINGHSKPLGFKVTHRLKKKGSYWLECHRSGKPRVKKLGAIRRNRLPSIKCNCTWHVNVADTGAGGIKVTKLPRFNGHNHVLTPNTNEGPVIITLCDIATDSEKKLLDAEISEIGKLVVDELKILPEKTGLVRIKRFLDEVKSEVSIYQKSYEESTRDNKKNKLQLPEDNVMGNTVQADGF